MGFIYAPHWTHICLNPGLVSVAHACSHDFPHTAHAQGLSSVICWRRGLFLHSRPSLLGWRPSLEVSFSCTVCKSQERFPAPLPAPRLRDETCSRLELASEADRCRQHGANTKGQSLSSTLTRATDLHPNSPFFRICEYKRNYSLALLKIYVMSEVSRFQINFTSKLEVCLYTSFGLPGLSSPWSFVCPKNHFGLNHGESDRSRFTHLGCVHHQRTKLPRLR